MNRTLKDQWQAVAALYLLGVVVLFYMTGCSSTTRTHEEIVSSTPQDQTTASGPNAASGQNTASGPEAGETRTITETTTTTVEAEHGGVISGIVHVIGSIIAFPFKVIGGIFEAIF